MGVIRRLVTVVELQADKAAKALAKYDTLWKNTAKSIGTYAFSIESDANRVIAATQRMAAAANAAPRPGRDGGAGASGGGGGSGGVSRMPSAKGSGGARTPRGGDDLDRAIAAANKAEGARAASQAKASAQMAGLAAGTQSVKAASDALGVFATKSDRARAAVRDLEAQVARNRREMADLKVQSLATGDADGRLADRMRGLSVATGQAMVKLADARKELRAVDGGLIDAVKNSGRFTVGLGAMAVAAGNFISAGLSRVFREVSGAVVGATEKAIKFESSFADVKKVLPDDMSVAKVEALEAGLLKLGPAVGVLPTQMAELTAGLAQSGIAGDELLGVAEDASKVGVAFDLTGKEAGAAFASIQAALGTTRGETNSLFDTINELSNGMNSTAAQLVDVEQRVGSVGRAMSLSGETVAALGSALVSTGASSEVAATGVRTFLARLGAGEAATDKQLTAFKALGLSAKDVAKELSSGDTARAEKQIRGVVSAIQGLKDEDRLPVLIEMFGSESIGTIGALATNVELLGTAFEISGNKTRAAGSVQKEFENRSKTTEHQLARVKASVEVLAIEFGKHLLPYINEVADFLNSDAGKEWGASAVQKATAFVVGLANAIKTTVGIISGLTDALGGTAVAVAAVGAAAIALTGPFGLAAAAAVAAGYAIASAFDKSSRSMREMVAQAEDIRAKERKAALGEQQKELDQEQAGADAQHNVSSRTRALEKAYAKKLTAEGLNEVTVARRVARLSLAVAGSNRELGGGTAEDRLDEWGRRLAGVTSAPAAVSLAEQGRGKGRRGGGGGHGRGHGHEPTEMDKRLAAMDPALAGVLRGGGALDAGGDTMVHKDILSRSVYAKQIGGTDSGSSPGPGPNVTTNYYDNKVIQTITVDASSSGGAADNMRQAAADLGASASNVRWVNASKVVANRNAGGRMG